MSGIGSSSQHKERRAEVYRFIRQIDMLNAVKWYKYDQGHNVWCVAELFIKLNSTTEERHVEGSNQVTSRSYQRSLSENTVRMYFAFSPLGLKTDPIFLVTGQETGDSWYEKVGLTINEGRETGPQVVEDEWFPANGVVMCTHSRTLTRPDMERVFYELNAHIRMVSTYADSKLMLIPHSLGKSKSGVNDVCKALNMDFALYNEALSFLDPFTTFVSPTVRGRMVEAETRIKDMYSGTVGTVQRKIMVGVAGHKKLSAPEIVYCFTVCGIWPLRKQYDGLDFSEFASA